MADTREYLKHIEHDDSISISEDVLAAIATKAAGEIEGVASVMNQTMTDQLTEQLTRKKVGRGVRVAIENDEIVLDISIMARYGYAIPEVAEKVQQAIISAVGSMTNFGIRTVNVHVGGITLA